MDSFRKMKDAVGAVRRAVPGVRDWFETVPPECREADRLLAAGRPEDAEAHLLSVIQQVRQKDAEGMRLAKVQLSLATVLQRMQKHEAARESALAALSVFETLGPRATADKGTCLELLANAAVQLEEFEDAALRFAEAGAAETSVEKPDSSVLGRRSRGLGDALMRLESWEEALAAFEDAAQHYRTAAGGDDKDVADCVFEAGRCQLSLERSEEALASFDLALELHRRTCGNESDEVARDYQTLAAAYQHTGDLEKAVTFYERALYLRERQLGGNKVDLGLLLMSLADVQSVLGRYATAMELLQQAVGRLEGARDSRLPEALSSLGNAYLQTGRYEDAAQVLTRARGIWQQDPVANGAELENSAAILEELLPVLEQEEEAEPQSIFRTETDQPRKGVVRFPKARPGAPAAAAGGEPGNSAVARIVQSLHKGQFQQAGGPFQTGPSAGHILVTPGVPISGPGAVLIPGGMPANVVPGGGAPGGVYVQGGVVGGVPASMPGGTVVVGAAPAVHPKSPEVPAEPYGFEDLNFELIGRPASRT